MHIRYVFTNAAVPSITIQSSYLPRIGDRVVLREGEYARVLDVEVVLYEEEPRAGVVVEREAEPIIKSLLQLAQELNEDVKRVEPMAIKSLLNLLPTLPRFLVTVGLWTKLNRG